MGQTRVFVVEDHAATARALKSYLELSGYAVDVAADMRSALRFAATSAFDVLVCDLHLPDGTGWQLMKRLNASANVDGIAFSAFDGPADRERSRRAGFAEHVAKGSNPEALLHAIKRVASLGPVGRNDGE